MNELNEELREKLATLLEEGLGENPLRAIKKQVEDMLDTIESELDYRLKDELAPNLAIFVAEMADKAIGALLAGNEEQMRNYLSCRDGYWTGRSDSPYCSRDLAEQHPIIHGLMSEQGCIVLRRDIVAAHRDLITSQRILDLEDQVKSLTAQANKEKSAREAMYERCREYL